MHTVTEKPYRIVARREFEGFLQVTAFRCLQFIKHSSHWSESIVWIVLLTCATMLAIQDVRKVCEEYANEETYTSMGVRGLENLTFNDAIICVEYDPHALNLADFRLVHSAEEAPSVVELARRANVSAVEFLNRSLKLLTVISLIENGRSADYIQKVDQLQRDENLEVLHDWLKAQKVNITELSTTVGNWLCKAVQINIETIKLGVLSSSTDACDQTKISWLGVIPFTSVATSEIAFCLNIGQQITFESMLDRLVIKVSTDDLFKGAKYSGKPNVNDYLLNSYVDFTGDPVSTDMTKEFIQFPDVESASRCVALEITVEAEFYLIDRRVARCNPEATSRLDCYGKCDVFRYELTEDCNCTPLAWSYLYGEKNRTLCFDTYTIQQYLDCRRGARPHMNVSELCWQSCLFPCKHKSHYVGYSTEDCYDMDNREGTVSLELSPKRFTVPTFQEHFSVSVSELFSRLGGTCGLWLGVGVLGMCHALLFPFKLILKFFQYNIRVHRASTPLNSVELK